jgi:hypothetical protein
MATGIENRSRRNKDNQAIIISGEREGRFEVARRGK